MKIKDLPKEYLEMLAKPFCEEVLTRKSRKKGDLEELLDRWGSFNFDSFYYAFTGSSRKPKTAEMARLIKKKLDDEKLGQKV